MDNERTEQAIAQCKVVAHLAKAIIECVEDQQRGLEFGLADLVEIVGGRTAAQMETLGNMLNGMDAVTEEDAWTDPVFEKARNLWPLTPA